MKIVGGHASLPKKGELANGDAAILRVGDATRALFGVIDGLGHGPDAAAVSRTAIAYLEQVSLEVSLYDIMEHLHAKLGGSRGAAATICTLKGRVLDACAVGNVELRSSDTRFPLVFSAGILGVSVRKFRVCSATLERPARFVAFSDGISSRARTDEFRQLNPMDACNTIIKQYRRESDDATVLVADLE